MKPPTARVLTSWSSITRRRTKLEYYSWPWTAINNGRLVSAYIQVYIIGWQAFMQRKLDFDARSSPPSGVSWHLLTIYLYICIYRSGKIRNGKLLRNFYLSRTYTILHWKRPETFPFYLPSLIKQEGEGRKFKFCRNEEKYRNGATDFVVEHSQRDETVHSSDGENSRAIHPDFVPPILQGSIVNYHRIGRASRWLVAG